MPCPAVQALSLVARSLTTSRPVTLTSITSPPRWNSPRERPAGYRVAEQQAFVLHEVLRVLWPAVAGQVGWCGTGQNPRLHQLAHDEAGRFRLSETYRRVKALSHQIAQGVTDHELERKRRVLR
jgi:hypothetical protein